jgi:hypothetical protein
MNRKITLKSAVHYRPKLDALEDRLVLSPVTFHIVQNQSPLTLSGSIGGVDFQQQGSHSLITTYFGDFQADIDEANGIINFIGTGNDFCAANTGNWAPREDGSSGTAPAIYGLQADLSGTLLVAIRDFHLKADTFGSGIALYQNNDGSFGYSSSQTITINAGSGTYSHPDLGSGPVDLHGLNGPNQAGDGALTDDGAGNLTITVPVSISVGATIGGMDSILNVDGQIVGTGGFAGPRPGGGSHTDPTIGVALVHNMRSANAASPVAMHASAQNPASENLPGVILAAVDTPSRAQDLHRSDAMAWAVQHAMPAAFDQLAALDTVFQELA